MEELEGIDDTGWGTVAPEFSSAYATQSCSLWELNFVLTAICVCVGGGVLQI